MFRRRVVETLTEYHLRLIGVVLALLTISFSAVILWPTFEKKQISIFGQAVEGMGATKVIGLVMLVIGLLVLVPMIFDRLRLGHLGLFLAFLLYTWFGTLYLVIDNATRSLSFYPFSIALISMILYLVFKTGRNGAE